MMRYSCSGGPVCRLLLSLLFALSCAACSGLPAHKRAMPAGHFAPPLPEVWQLDNGLTVMFLEDRELPLINGSLIMKGGDLWAPADRPGLSAALGDQMRDGGAGQLGAEDLDRRLRDLSAEISSDFDAEYGTVGFSCLSTDFTEVFGLMSDVVLRPRFESARLDLWKARVIDGIRRRVEDPGEVAGLAFRQLVYGQSAYGRVSTEADISRIRPSDLQALHRRFVSPLQAVLALSGNASAAEVRGLVQKHFGSWAVNSDPVGNFPGLDFDPQPGLYFIKLPFQQATVNMGMQGVPRLTPDMIAIDVFNEMFGSGKFGSRLFRKVRTEMGLSYSVYGGIYAGPLRGMNMISLQTKGNETGRAIIEALSVLHDFQSRPVSLEELSDAKRVIENSFVFKFDSRAEIVRRRAFLRFLQYPADHYETYLPRIAAVTPQDVGAVAVKRWASDRFVVVVVGDENAYNSLQTVLPQFPEGLRRAGIRLVQFDQRLILK